MVLSRSCAEKSRTVADSHSRYAKEFLAGWGTMDFNGHLANTAYLNLAADVRLAFFADEYRLNAAIKHYP